MSSPQPPDQPPSPATGAGNLSTAARIAWQRARSFNFLQPSAPNRSGAAIAPWLWPVELLAVARESPRIRRLGSASMTLTGLTRGRADPVILLAAAAAYLLFVMAVIIAGSATAITLARFTGMELVPAAVLGLVIPLAPLLIEVARRVVHVLRHPENRTIRRRRRQLAQITGGSVVIMTAFVRAHPGEGAALLTAMRHEWDREHVTVVLNPANKELAGYYRRHGAVLDAATWRRQSIPPGPTAPGLDQSPAATGRNPLI